MDARTTHLPKIHDHRGHLSFFQNNDQIPFEIKGAQWFSSAASSASKHAEPNPSTGNFIVALSGRFDIVLFDGQAKEQITLNRPDIGIYVPPSIRRQLHNFSPNSLALIVTDTPPLQSHEACADHTMSQSTTRCRPSIADCALIEFPHIDTSAGCISLADNNLPLPFKIKRIYYLYDIPRTASRGGHAHKAVHQLIIAARGSFEVTIDDSINKKTIRLSTPNVGLHIPRFIWRTLSNFSPGAICLALASEKYLADDYVRDYNEFLNYRPYSQTL